MAKVIRNGKDMLLYKAKISRIDKPSMLNSTSIEVNLKILRLKVKGNLNGLMGDIILGNFVIHR